MNIEVGFMDVGRQGCSSCDDTRTSLGIYIQCGIMRIRLCQKCGRELATKLVQVNCQPNRQEIGKEG